jgi:hypothetical protein
VETHHADGATLIDRISDDVEAAELIQEGPHLMPSVVKIIDLENLDFVHGGTSDCAAKGHSTSNLFVMIS